MSKKQWIEDTQLFQQIAGVTVTSTDELSKDYDYDEMKKKHSRKKMEVIDNSAATHRTIAEVASGMYKK